MRSVPRVILVLATVARAVRAFASAPASWRRPAKLAPHTHHTTLVLHEAAEQSTPVPSSCDISAEDSSPRELQFDMIGLMREEADAERQARKADSLAAIFRACSLASMAQDESGHAEEKGEPAVLPDHLAPLRRFLCTSSDAKDHQGGFRVFTKAPPSPRAASMPPLPVSMPPNVLFSKERPLVYLRDALSYQSAATIQKRGGMMYDSSEAVLWCSSTVGSQEDLEFASRVLDDMPFAELRLGSGAGHRSGEDVDRDAHLVVELELKTVQVLESLGVLLGNDGDVTSGDRRGTHTVCCKLKSDDLAVIETMLDCYKQEPAHESLRDQNQPPSTIAKLIDAAVEAVRKDPLNESNEPHLVLLAHSISASAVAAAISAWKRTEQKHLSTRRVEDLLHQAVTVVTFGNVSPSFCDGPAYIHVSMYDDPWTSALGRHGARPARGGRAAVYFHACSPYAHDQVRWEAATAAASARRLTSHNAHNLQACTLPYLYLLLRINGLRSFRALYEAASFVDPALLLDIGPRHFAVECSHGDLVVPPHIDDELLPALIRATGGARWLWRSAAAAEGAEREEDDTEALLPDEIETRSHLEESFGYNVLEEIYATCRRS